MPLSSVEGSQKETFYQQIFYKHFGEACYGFNDFLKVWEAKTNQSKRADILFVGNRPLQKPYLIAVEVKSRGTLPNLKPQDNFRRRTLISRWLVISILVVLAVAGANFQLKALTLALSGVALVALLAGFSGLLKRKEVGFAKKIPVLDQLLQYPANEKWVAIPHDTFVKDSDYDTLKIACRGSGIGLVVLDAIGELVIKVRPRPVHEKNGYLHHYLKEEEILEQLGDYRVFGRSSFQWLKIARQVLGLLTALLLFWLLVMPKTDWGTTRRRSESGSVFEAVLTSCNQFYSIEEGSILIVVEGYNSETKVKQRLQQLEGALPFSLRYTNSHCFERRTTASTYFIYVDKLYVNRGTAAKETLRLNDAFSNSNLTCSFCRPVKVK